MKLMTKEDKLAKISHEYGPGQGRILLLPYDHGLEHGPSDFFDNEKSKDPEYILSLAEEAGVSGVVLHIGIAKKYWYERYRDKIPLVLKLNGKTNIPSDEAPISPLVATPEEAFELGACAIGYTLYVGSPRQDEDFERWREIRIKAEEFDIPTIMWSYPRGKYVEAHGGRDSFAMVDYAARVALELGADLVKLNMPKKPKSVDTTTGKIEENYDPKGKYRKYNDTLSWSQEKMVRELVKTAGKTQVLIAGGEKKDYNEMMREVEECLRAGVTGFVIGRNVFMRPKEEAISLIKDIKDIMRRYPKI